jgi:MFS family permease
MFYTLTQSVLRFIRPGQSIPQQYRKIFTHLYWDMAWLGVVSGTTITFLSVYATRRGASSDQIGFLNAAPALINLLLALPIGNLVKARRLSRWVFWSSGLARIFYLPMALLPWLINPKNEVWALVLITLVMSVPLTILQVSFNAFFIDVVPNEWRAQVVGVRNSLLSIVSLLVSLVSGQILVRTSFPVGYQIVFGIGFIGAMLSTLQLFYLRNTSRMNGEELLPVSSPNENVVGMDSQAVRILQSRYVKVLLLLFCFHLSQYLVIPVVPLFSVRGLGLTDFQFSVAGALFNLVVFLGAFWVSGVIARLGNRKATGLGVIGLGLFPLLLAITQNAGMFVLTHLIGGISWSLLAVAYYNYMLENVPAHTRSLSISWYILAANAAILIGSLSGPLVADAIGFQTAFLLFGVLRVLSGVAILRWG